MIPQVLLVGFCAVLAVAAIGVSLFAVWRTQALLELSDGRSRARLEEMQTAVTALEEKWNAHAAQLEDLQREPQPAVLPGAPRAGLNLCKRSQVLRMHRSGASTDRIAAALEVPQQEVDLLIKVHRIVIGSL